MLSLNTKMKNLKIEKNKKLYKTKKVISNSPEVKKTSNVNRGKKNWEHTTKPVPDHSEAGKALADAICKNHKGQVKEVRFLTSLLLSKVIA